MTITLDPARPAGDRLPDPAADVIARDHYPAQAEFPDEGDDAAGLGCR